MAEQGPNTPQTVALEGSWHRGAPRLQTPEGGCFKYQKGDPEHCVSGTRAGCWCARNGNLGPVQMGCGWGRVAEPWDKGGAGTLQGQHGGEAGGNAPESRGPSSVLWNFSLHPTVCNSHTRVP